MKREGSGDSRALPNDTSLTSVPATYSKSSPSFHLSSGGAPPPPGGASGERWAGAACPHHQRDSERQDGSWAFVPPPWGTAQL